MGFNREIAQLIITLRELDRKLDADIAISRQKKLDKINFEEQEALAAIHKKYAEKRSIVERMPIGGSAVLRNKIEQTNQKIYLAQAKLIKEAEEKAKA